MGNSTFRFYRIVLKLYMYSNLLYITRINASLSPLFSVSTIVVIALLYDEQHVLFWDFPFHAIVNVILVQSSFTQKYCSAHILQCAVAKLRACYPHS